jgi:hypothetical protein
MNQAKSGWIFYENMLKYLVMFARERQKSQRKERESDHVYRPSHRVIGADESPAGYAGGLSAKEQLIKMEKERMQKL